MLAYTYEDLSLTNLAGLRHFYRRRFLAVGIPYLCWTLIYFFFLMPTAHYSGVVSALRGLAKVQNPLRLQKTGASSHNGRGPPPHPRTS